MKLVPGKTLLAASVALSVGVLPAPASPHPQQDNTRQNSTSSNSGTATAEQQANDKSDVDITAKIRRAIVRNKSLSLYAHNVKIITRGGRVTLKGPVRSDEERQAVIAAAQGVAGNGNITDELTVRGH